MTLSSFLFIFFCWGFVIGLTIWAFEMIRKKRKA